MGKIVELSELEYQELAKVVELQAPPGATRNAYMMRQFAGRGVMPSRRLWIESFCKIEDKQTGKLIPFQFNRVQRAVEAWRLRCERANIPQRAVMLKSRQHGVSTQFVAYGQEAVLRDTSDSLFRAGIVGQEDDTSKELLENGKLMRDSLPWQLPHKYDNRSVIWYDRPINGYIDILSARTKGGGRGKHYRFLHMTEVAFWPKPEETFTALAQTVPRDPGTMLTIETTANGAGGWFWEFFWAAWEGKNDYTAMFFPWTWDPDLRIALVGDDEEEIRDTLTDEEEVLIEKHRVDLEQLKWRRWAIQNLCGGSLDLFHQEYPSTPLESFITSGRPVFLPALVQAAKDYCFEPIWQGDVIIRSNRMGDFRFDLIEDKTGPLKIWAQPVVDGKYCAGSDSSEGVGGDFCTIEVAEVQTGCQVAEYASNWVNANLFGEICVALCTHFNMAWWLPEVNPPGNATMQVALDLGFPRILRRPIFGRAGQVIEMKLGWQTKEESKRLLVKEIRSDLGGEHHSVASTALCQELSAYQVEDSGRMPSYSAPRGAHDDLVIAWGVNRMARRMIFEQAIEAPENDVPRETFAQRHWREFEETLASEEDDEEEEEWG